MYKGKDDSIGMWGKSGYKAAGTWDECTGEGSLDKVSVDSTLFGFMPGKGMIDTIFVVRQMQ